MREVARVEDLVLRRALLNVCAGSISYMELNSDSTVIVFTFDPQINVDKAASISYATSTADDFKIILTIGHSVFVV